MKNRLLLATTLITALSASSAFAMHGDDGKRNCECMRSGQSHAKGEHSRRGKIPSQEEMNRVFTAEQIRTLNEARLIMKGNPNLKVGNVVATENGYRVTIVTKDNSLVEEREVAKNNMPLRRARDTPKSMTAKPQQ